MPPEPFTLAFDTSAAHCAAALLKGNNLLAERLEPMERGQGERLFPLLEGLLAEGGIGWPDLSVIGVGIGPGNFTGVRISVAAARGLALSLGLPAVGVSVLRAQAHGVGGPVISSLDARQDRLYLQLFGTGGTSAPVLAALPDLPALPAGTAPVCIGHRAGELAALTGGRAGTAPRGLACTIGLIAAAERHRSPAPPAPLYLRPADAAPAREAPPRIIA